MEPEKRGKKAAKPPSKFTRALKKLRDDLRRGHKSRQVCQHKTTQNEPCQQLGWPVVLDRRSTKLGWACRVHRNGFKRAHGLEVYRRANIPRPRAKRKMPYVDVWKGVDKEQWLKDRGDIPIPIMRPGRLSLRKVDVWKGIDKERWIRQHNRRIERRQLKKEADDLRKLG